MYCFGQPLNANILAFRLRIGIRPIDRPSTMLRQQVPKRQSLCVPGRTSRATERFLGVRPILLMMFCNDRHQSARGFSFLTHQSSGKHFSGVLDIYHITRGHRNLCIDNRALHYPWVL